MIFFCYLIILIPLINFFIFHTLLKNVSKRILLLITNISIFPFFTLFLFFASKNKDFLVSTFVYNWIKIKDFKIPFYLYIDKFSLVMISIIFVISFLIYLYSYWYFKNSFEYKKFLSKINLFIFGMILLVTANNFLFAYFGWEIIGMCSYLLVSFYNNQKNSEKFSKKVFFTTKIGDLILLISFLIIYKNFKTLEFEEIQNILRTSKIYFSNFEISTAIFLFFIGAISKSVQVPMHIWLPNAMIGPTPASAIIHSSTMITAGIYLIIRNYDMFIMYPFMLKIIESIGIITIIFGAFCACRNKKIKKILAYSTISQIGYVFVFIGTKNIKLAALYTVCHAFFKCLLFLVSGNLIKFSNEKSSIKSIGTNYKSIFLLYFCFLLGSLSMMGFPLFSGFFAKKEIISVFIEKRNYFYAFLLFIGAALTSIYTFKMIFLIFYRERNKNFKKSYSFFNIFPIIILAIFSTFLTNIIYEPILQNHFIKEKTIENTHLLNFYIEFFLLFLNILVGILSKKYFLYGKPKIRIELKSLDFLKKINSDCFCKKIFFHSYLILSRMFKNDLINLVIEKTISTVFQKIKKKSFLLLRGKINIYIFYIGICILLILIMIIFYKENFFNNFLSKNS
ncbi:NADH-quinone oxidoreductase subunit L [bacterium endosymbiont of Pedicinus badii]|uniref:NADH-quinone oxidoreductase subunit 5 family protein n=1 Tax=bacterium endosymbiont of Pedicinus badii TaxID=1719126 RepID=UPI0009BAB6A5|nr:NADH-quinone oxidoreductase subunit L [bacterium endosymbiont of Pedicinus badii]OQM34447.1 hypothetical protein AOQ89_00980 [bacterium endosymbiont of Pedicinus badii]